LLRYATYGQYNGKCRRRVSDYILWSNVTNRSIIIIYDVIRLWKKSILSTRKKSFGDRDGRSKNYENPISNRSVCVDSLISLSQYLGFSENSSTCILARMIEPEATALRGRLVVQIWVLIISHHKHSSSSGSSPKKPSAQVYNHITARWYWYLRWTEIRVATKRFQLN